MTEGDTGGGNTGGGNTGEQTTDDGLVRAVVFVRGRVQGVGFRWWTRARALELGLAGHARNLPDGRVEVCAQGRKEHVRRLHQLLSEESGPRSRPGHVAGTTVQWHPPKPGLTGFAER